MSIETIDEMAAAARWLQAKGARHVLIKGGHRRHDATDVLLTGTELHRFEDIRINTASTHGTGCTYASAIATFLAQGLPIVPAVTRAKQFIGQAIRLAVPLGQGHGPVNHFAAAQALQQHSKEDL